MRLLPIFKGLREWLKGLRPRGFEKESVFAGEKPWRVLA
jgi:hypothetical protein